MGTILVQDPHHDYATRFIRLLRDRHGHRAVALFTGGAKERFYRRHERVPDAELHASYAVDPSDLDGLAAHLRAKLPDLVAVVPYSEETVELAAKLVPRLGLRWNDEETLLRFRRKAELKDHLRRFAPSVRVNFSVKVSSAREVLDLGSALPEKFVLKPDAGYGSVGVAILRRGEPVERLERAFRAAPGVTFILEEFLDGPLYTVDGLVDAEGNLRVVSVFHSARRQLNGCPVVYGDGHIIHEDTPLFAELADYACAVMRATGLRRSPFHMEVIRDARGPCLVEVAARLIGNSHAVTINFVHGDRFDFFAEAAAGYLGKPMNLDVRFDRYNSVDVMRVNGASEVEGIAYAVHGVEEVEALPCFSRWVVKPRPGALLRKTVDTFTMPYACVLIGQRGHPVREAAARAHALLRFETRAPFARRVRVGAALIAERARRKAAWVAEQARQSVAPAT